MGKSVSIIVGGLLPSVKEQLAAQGHKLKGNDALIWQKRMMAIVYLSVAGMLTQAEKDRVGKRLANAIAREVVPLND